MAPTEQAHIEGTVDVAVEPTEYKVTWSENQIVLHYAGEVSVLPLDGDGFVSSRRESYQADAHTDEMVDVALGVYERHTELMERDE